MKFKMIPTQLMNEQHVPHRIWLSVMLMAAGLSRQDNFAALHKCNRTSPSNEGGGGRPDVTVIFPNYL